MKKLGRGGEAGGRRQHLSSRQSIEHLHTQMCHVPAYQHSEVRSQFSFDWPRHSELVQYIFQRNTHPLKLAESLKHINNLLDGNLFHSPAKLRAIATWGKIMAPWISRNHVSLSRYFVRSHSNFDFQLCVNNIVQSLMIATGETEVRFRVLDAV